MDAWNYEICFYMKYEICFCLMRFMIIDTCEIIMSNHTCEIIDFISGGRINKPL